MGRRILVLVAAFAVLAPAAPAAAKRPAGSRPDVATLRAAGLRVTWPLRTATATVRPGTTLKVRVRGTGARSRSAARLAFTEVSSTGRHRRTLVAAALRAGTFTIVVPARANAHYALTLTVGKVTFRSWIDTPKPGATAPPAAAGLTPGTYTPPPVTPPEYGPYPGGGPYGDPMPWPCPGDGRPGVTMTLGSATAAAGGLLPYTLLNTGRGCVLAGLGYELQRLVGQNWEPLGPIAGFPAVAIPVPAGSTLGLSAVVPDDAATGRYRIRTWVTDGGGPSPATAEASQEFDVVS